MNQCIKKALNNYSNAHPLLTQWGWFILLWLGGLGASLAVAYPIKLLIRTMQ